MRSKHIIILILWLSTLQINAQNQKIYVSTKGGKKIFLLGSKRYDHIRLALDAGPCDTLICSGKGFEKCKIDKWVLNLSETNKTKYGIYNKAIKASHKRIKRSKKKEDLFYLSIKGRKLKVNYFNAGEKGNVEMVIELI